MLGISGKPRWDVVMDELSSRRWGNFAPLVHCIDDCWGRGTGMVRSDIVVLRTIGIEHGQGLESTWCGVQINWRDAG